MSIPMRLIILYHEFFHHFWDSSDETLMDVSALNVYLAQGFAKSEALYAFTRVFNDYEPLKKRVKVNDSYIRDFAYVNEYLDKFQYNS